MFDRQMSGLTGLIARLFSWVLGIGVIIKALSGARRPQSIPTNGPHPQGSRATATVIEDDRAQKEHGDSRVEGTQPASSEGLRPGWNIPQPEHLPEPTYWPAVMGVGIVFVAWSLITTYMLAIIGLILFAVALAGWIGDIRHEHKD